MSDALFLGLGFLIGFLGGLLPGLHSNTIISVLASLGLDENMLALLIIALFPAHMVSSFIPSMFFGIPEANTVITVLPGQRMVLRGKGIAALKTVLLSCIFTAVLSLGLFSISLEFFPLVHGVIRPYMKYILLAISLLLLSRGRRPHYSAAIFLASGLLGYFSLNSDMQDPFLPLFTGMFAMAAIASYSKCSVPEQEEANAEPSALKYAVIGALGGIFSLLIPGVGSPSQIATFMTIFLPLNTMAYLSAASAISISQGILSLSTAASIGKSRVGATVWLSSLMDIENSLLFLVVISVLAVVLAAAIIYAGRMLIARVASIDFSIMNAILAIYILAVTFVIDGFLGLGVLAVGAGLGMITLRLKVERTTLMGSLILPTLILLFT